MSTARPLQDVLYQEWFGELDEQGRAPAHKRALWFGGGEDFDARLRQRFGAALQSAARGELDHWQRSPRGVVALVLLLDQLSRNIFRGSPQMFAQDAQALQIVDAALERGDDRRVGLDPRVFLYMPLMHAEDLERQERCVALFAQLAQELEGEDQARVQNNLNYAIAHRDIIRDWGRFPHRNAVLGRESTPEEEAFLRQPGSSF